MPSVRIDRPIRRRAALLRSAALLALPAWVHADDTVALRELRAGAVVLMRHTQTTPGAGDPPGWRLEQCASQRNLDADGIAHAGRIGRWYVANELRIAAVRNSPWCRTRDTALLAFGRQDDWSALSNLYDDRSHADAQVADVKRYVESLPTNELVVLVSHGSTIGHIVPGHGGLAPGEAVVVRRGASAGAALAVLGRLAVP